MTKILVLTIGIVWASLLLISWGGAEDIARHTTPATSSGLDTARTH